MSDLQQEPSERVVPEDDRSFFLLVGAMFQGSFSDNLYRLMLVIAIILLAKQDAGGDPEQANTLAANYQAIISALFILPYVLAVSLAGWLADRFSKTRVVQWTKAMEVGVMILATLTYAFGPGIWGVNAVWAGGVVLFLMGLQSALFSPARYGLMAELLPANRLGWGNGLIQGFIFLAVIMGTIAGPIMFDVFEDRLWLPGLGLVACGLVGLVLTMRIRYLPAANPAAKLELNPLTPLFKSGRVLWNDLGMRWSTIGIVVWWSSAVMLQGAAVLAATNVLGLDAGQTGVALLPVIVAQGGGCFLASYLCRERIELGLVPFGAVGMLITSLAVWWMTPLPDALDAMRDAGNGELPTLLVYGIPALIAMIGFTTAFFIVPLEAFINERSHADERGAIWAAENVLSASGMLVGAALTMAATWLRDNPGDIFLGAGFLMGVAGLILCWRFPNLPLRFMMLVFLRSSYRVRVAGLEHVPKHGGALIAPNHQSYIDGILVAASLERPVRFVMSSQVYQRWFIYPFARLTRSIPIEQNQSPRELIVALRAAADEIRAGGLVCIFPEGQLSRNGQMQPFRRGVERIMRDLHVPIIPVAIDGAYETGWAVRMGQLSRSTNGGWMSRGELRVAFGEALPSTTPAAELRQAVSELLLEAFARRKERAVPLHRMAITALRKRPLLRSYSDHNTPACIPNYKVLAAIAALGAKLAPRWRNEEFVGLLLPPSIGTLAVNIAVTTAGRVPVNLNYTTSPQIMEETCRTAGIRLIISSKAFMEKARLTAPSGCEMIYLEDVRESITALERITGLLRGLLLPVAVWERSLGRTKAPTMDDLATLIFSSGSTGQPKGVMLTHWNLTSNIQGTLHYVELQADSRFLGALPFFHSFGYMSTLWLPLTRNVGVSFHPNPLDAKAIGAIVERDHVTHLFATPTFLSTYIRRVEPGQFGSLRFVLTGAEKLKQYIVDGFRSRFGIEPIEGFGTTECSPSVSLNGEDYREPGIFQSGRRAGTVGQPIPGMHVRIVGLDDGLPVAIGQSGMLLVRGHGVMQGYYRMPELTAEALQNGWYKTGDVASLDEDGFLTIRDRLARFSKIAGEMVPHVRIEEALQQIAGATDPVFAVTAVPDDKKGERLIVVYTLPEAQAKAACEQLASPELNLPALWLPRWNDFFPIEAIPALGSGKLDLRAIKQFAREAVEKRDGG